MRGRYRGGVPDARQTRITIAVPTFRRPGLLRDLLPLLVAQAQEVEAALGAVVDVLVVDNDSAASARAIVGTVPAVRYVVEPRPGISAARNRAMDESTDSTLLAFLDDDERPEPDWLRELVRTWEGSGAAAVSGRVLAEYAAPPDPWLVAGGFFQRRSLVTGTDIEVAAAGNLLLDLDQIRRSGVRFDDRLGLTGGEDGLFSRSLRARGGRMVWCDESRVVDLVPAERMTRTWVLSRAWSHGNSQTLVDLWLAPAPSWAIRVRSAARGLALAGLGILRWAVGALTLSVGHRARGLRMAARGGGMLAGALGHVHHEYRRDD
jgi:hypothetical protein